LLQAVYLLNLVVWAAAWATGAGFGLGGDSVVVLLGGSVDAVPAFPIIAALPTGAGATWWNLLWLAWGVTAGAAAAWIVLRARPRARFDETALVGGLSGLVAGLVFWLVALLARGNLGVTRLVGLGPLVLETLVLVPTLLGLAGLVTGLVAGLLRSPAKVSSASQAVAAASVTQPPMTDGLTTGDVDGVTGAGLSGVGGSQPGSEPVDEATRLLRRPTGGAPEVQPQPTIGTPGGLPKPQEVQVPSDQLWPPPPAALIDQKLSAAQPRRAKFDPTVAMGNPFNPDAPGANQPPLDFTDSDSA